MKYKDYFTITDCADEAEIAEIIASSRMLQSPAEKENPDMNRQTIHHTKRRLVPTLIAAAAAAVVLTVGTAAYITYNKHMVQSYFGTIGEARASELELAEPAYYTNGKVGVTAEALLNDGSYGLLFLTIDKLDETIPDFKNERGNYEIHPAIHFAEQPGNLSAIVEGIDTDENDPNRVHLAFRFSIPDDIDASAGTVSFKNVNINPDGSADEVITDGFEGIEIPLDLSINTKQIHMVSEEGRELDLSGYEAVTPDNYGIAYCSDMSITWKNGKEQQIGLNCGAGFGGDGGEESVLSFRIAADGSDITEPEFSGDPDTWYGYLDIDEVASIRIHNTTYYPE